MVDDLTFMLIGPCDSRSQEADVLSGESHSYMDGKLVHRMKKILQLREILFPQQSVSNVKNTPTRHSGAASVFIES